MDTGFVRSHFPGLQSEWVFMDNAGGSQVVSAVSGRILEFFRTSNVQLGASYDPSVLAVERVDQAQKTMARYIHAADPGEVIMGSSTSLLLRMLASNLGRYLPKGSEIIVTNCDHEANIGCWLELEKEGMVVRTWKLNPDTYRLETADLEKLMNPLTRLVAFTHASNILGTVNPVKEITEMVHAHGAWVCVDGVAYAPHRMIDVKDWDVDFYVFSFYKTYGPHYALLYGRKEILLDLPGNNHYFIGKNEIPYKFQPGHVNFEIAWGMTGLPDYFDGLYRYHFPGEDEPEFRSRLERVSGLIRDHETVLSARLLDFLNSRPDIRIIGDTRAGENRVPTISFVVNGRDSESVVLETDKCRIGIRFGDFYAKRLIEYLGLAGQQGVVRVSMVHYNTLEEVERLVQCLEGVL
jgi:cysteine desulfurase family protein (TIGR01976 family)